MNSEPEQTVKSKNSTSYRSTGIIVSSQFKAKFAYLSHYVHLNFREEFENIRVSCPSACVVYAHATASKLQDLSNYFR